MNYTLFVTSSCKDQKRNNCGGCPLFPCSHFVNDSSISKEENEKNLKKDDWQSFGIQSID